MRELDSRKDFVVCAAFAAAIRRPAIGVGEPCQRIGQRGFGAWLTAPDAQQRACRVTVIVAGIAGVFAAPGRNFANQKGGCASLSDVPAGWT
jgi:hypothetical protein